MAKYRLLRDSLAADGHFTFEPAPLAPVDVIELAHEGRYVRDFLEGTLDPRAVRRIGFPWSQHLVRRTRFCRRDAGRHRGWMSGTMWGGTLAGGTHHAFYAEGSGFCVFNDLAIAIRQLQLSARADRVAVIDLDVHQGDGTAALFVDDPGVLTLSVHGRDNFPFRKQTSRIDVPLPDGTADDEYLAALAEVLPRAFEFKPHIVFYQSGVDALGSDRLGRLALTHEGLQRRDRMVFSSCAKSRVPCVVTLGGGYSEPIELTVEAHANTFRCAADVFA